MDLLSADVFHFRNKSWRTNITTVEGSYALLIISEGSLVLSVAETPLVDTVDTSIYDR